MSREILLTGLGGDHAGTARITTVPQCRLEPTHPTIPKREGHQ